MDDPISVLSRVINQMPGFSQVYVPTYDAVAHALNVALPQFGHWPTFN